MEAASMWVFGLFLVIPLIEIALFVTVGAWLTLWPTLAIVLFTGVLGAFLARWQGLSVLRDLQRAGPMSDPLSPLAHGALILIGGFLLMLPGFFTDFLGFMLMVPWVRRQIIAHLGARISVMNFQSGGFGARPGREPEGDWVDADYEVVPPERDKVTGPGTGRPSKWSRD
jgi:UPF0716 protein FxsA